MGEFVYVYLCATTIVILATIMRSKASCTMRSDAASNALVASSKSKIAGFFSTARAMAIRCFCPPELDSSFPSIRVVNHRQRTATQTKEIKSAVEEDDQIAIPVCTTSNVQLIAFDHLNFGEMKSLHLMKL